MKRLVAITHGDPAKTELCGRPLILRKRTDADGIGPEKWYVCVIHGTIRDKSPFSYFADDARPRDRFYE